MLNYNSNLPSFCVSTNPSSSSSSCCILFRYYVSKSAKSGNLRLIAELRKFNQQNYNLGFNEDFIIEKVNIINSIENLYNFRILSSDTLQYSKSNNSNVPYPTILYVYQLNLHDSNQLEGLQHSQLSQSSQSRNRKRKNSTITSNNQENDGDLDMKAAVKNHEQCEIVMGHIEYNEEQYSFLKDLSVTLNNTADSIISVRLLSSTSIIILTQDSLTVVSKFNQETNSLNNNDSHISNFQFDINHSHPVSLLSVNIISSSEQKELINIIVQFKTKSINQVEITECRFFSCEFGRDIHELSIKSNPLGISEFYFLNCTAIYIQSKSIVDEDIVTFNNCEDLILGEHEEKLSNDDVEMKYEDNATNIIQKHRTMIKTEIHTLLSVLLDGQPQLLYFVDGNLLYKTEMLTLATAINVVNFNSNEVIVIHQIDGIISIYSHNFPKLQLLYSTAKFDQPIVAFAYGNYLENINSSNITNDIKDTSDQYSTMQQFVLFTNKVEEVAMKKWRGVEGLIVTDLLVDNLLDCNTSTTIPNISSLTAVSVNVQQLNNYLNLHSRLLSNSDNNNGSNTKSNLLSIIQLISALNNRVEAGEKELFSINQLILNKQSLFQHSLRLLQQLTQQIQNHGTVKQIPTTCYCDSLLTEILPRNLQPLHRNYYNKQLVAAYSGPKSLKQKSGGLKETIQVVSIECKYTPNSMNSNNNNVNNVEGNWNIEISLIHNYSHSLYDLSVNIIPNTRTSAGFSISSNSSYIDELKSTTSCSITANFDLDSELIPISLNNLDFEVQLQYSVTPISNNNIFDNNWSQCTVITIAEMILPRFPIDTQPYSYSYNDSVTNKTSKPNYSVKMDLLFHRGEAENTFHELENFSQFLRAILHSKFGFQVNTISPYLIESNQHEKSVSLSNSAINQYANIAIDITEISQNCSNVIFSGVNHMVLISLLSNLTRFLPPSNTIEFNYSSKPILDLMKFLLNSIKNELAFHQQQINKPLDSSSTDELTRSYYNLLDKATSIQSTTDSFALQLLQFSS